MSAQNNNIEVQPSGRPGQSEASILGFCLWSLSLAVVLGSTPTHDWWPWVIAYGFAMAMTVTPGYHAGIIVMGFASISGFLLTVHAIAWLSVVARDCVFAEWTCNLSAAWEFSILEPYGAFGARSAQNEVCQLLLIFLGSLTALFDENPDAISMEG